METRAAAVPAGAAKKDLESFRSHPRARSDGKVHVLTTLLTACRGATREPGKWSIQLRSCRSLIALRSFSNRTIFFTWFSQMDEITPRIRSLTGLDTP